MDATSDVSGSRRKPGVTSHVVIRADSAVNIGSGHVMRCLSLADELSHRGHHCTFLTRAHMGHIAGQITERGHSVHLLPRADTPAPPVDWLGIDAETEATQSRAALAELKPDWVVVDHYGLGQDWVRDCCPKNARVLFIDDLADRKLTGDLLLDQTLERHPEAYSEKWPSQNAMLLGGGFALLRPSFAKLKAEMPHRSKTKGVGRVLLALGGMDADDISSEIVRVLFAIHNEIGMTRLDVALGATAPHLEHVRHVLADGPDFPMELHVGTPAMAQLMAGADIAIGGGGMMTWERCCLGLPTIAICLAENQRDGLRAAEKARALKLLSQKWVDDLPDALRQMCDPETRATMSEAASRLIDGQGCARVALAMAAPDLNCRPASLEDSKLVYEWRQKGVDPSQMLSGTATDLADHIAWFSQAVADTNRALLIVGRLDQPLGHVRLDRTDEDTARVSIVMAPETRGGGIGAQVLLVGLQHGQRLGITHFNAEIHRDNIASRRVFEKLGFTPVGKHGKFDLFSVKQGDPGLPYVPPSQNGGEVK